MPRSLLRRLCRDSHGILSVEAAVVSPLVVMLTVSVLFFGLRLYQTWQVRQLAHTTAARIAYTWDNHSKDSLSGRFDPALDDGMFWRLTADLAADPLSRYGDNVQSVEVTLPTSRTANDLITAKLAKASAYLPGPVTGAIGYRNAGLQRAIYTAFHRPFALSVLFAKHAGRSEPSGAAISYVADPVELIRLTEAARTYFPQIKKELSWSQTLSAFVEPATGQASKPPEIRSEKQAAAFLRSLVGGRARILSTPDGQSRAVDAYDADEVAHMAIYTFSETQLRSEQLPKDAALLRGGSPLRGIVWHFFHTQTLPSDALRRELAKSGIAVVIHGQ